MIVEMLKIMLQKQMSLSLKCKSLTVNLIKNGFSVIISSHIIEQRVQKQKENALKPGMKFYFSLT